VIEAVGCKTSFLNILHSVIVLCLMVKLGFKLQEINAFAKPGFGVWYLQTVVVWNRGSRFQIRMILTGFCALSDGETGRCYDVTAVLVCLLMNSSYRWFSQVWSSVAEAVGPISIRLSRSLTCAAGSATCAFVLTNVSDLSSFRLCWQQPRIELYSIIAKQWGVNDFISLHELYFWWKLLMR